MSRYIVIEVGCIECIGGGDSDPVVILATNDLAEAATATPEGRDEYRTEADSFVIDTTTGSIIRLPLILDPATTESEEK